MWRSLSNLLPGTTRRRCFRRHHPHGRRQRRKPWRVPRTYTFRRPTSHLHIGWPSRGRVCPARVEWRSRYRLPFGTVRCQIGGGRRRDGGCLHHRVQLQVMRCALNTCGQVRAWPSSTHCRTYGSRRHHQGVIRPRHDPCPRHKATASSSCRQCASRAGDPLWLDT